MSADKKINKRTSNTDTITKLRNGVLKQAEASLAYFLGTINFSDSMAGAAMSQRSKATMIAVVEAIPETILPFLKEMVLSNLHSTIRTNSMTLLAMLMILLEPMV